MLLPPAPCNRRSLEQWWRFRKLAACIIATNVVLHNRNAVERAVRSRQRAVVSPEPTPEREWLANSPHSESETRTAKAIKQSVPGNHHANESCSSRHFGERQPFVPSEKTEKKDLQPWRCVAVRVRRRQGELFGDGS